MKITPSTISSKNKRKESTSQVVVPHACNPTTQEEEFRKVMV
jgi:hypothetical protein